MTFNKQDILDAFKRRVATRYYDGNRKISDEDMKFILELGLRALAFRGRAKPGAA